MIRSPLTRRTPLTARTGLQRRSRLRAVSPKRRRELVEYERLHVGFLAGRTICEFPLGCIARSTVVHHRRGRFGARLLDVDWWAASCNFHNELAETQTGAALACGWLVPIEAAQ